MLNWLIALAVVLVLGAMVAAKLWKWSRNYTLVHISPDGRIFLMRRGQEEGNWVDAEQFERELQQLKESRGIVHYTVHHDVHFSDQVEKCMDRITEHELTIKLVAFHPLMWFEIQECPREFRFALLPDRSVLFGCKPDGHDHITTWIVEAGKNTELVLYVLEELDQLIRASRILDLSENDPDKVLEGDAAATPSFHIRLAFADGTAWRACYEKGRVPSEVQALFVGAREIGVKHLCAQDVENITPATSE